MTYQEPTHELGQIMLARHQAQDCVFGCPFCKQDEKVERILTEGPNPQTFCPFCKEWYQGAMCKCGAMEID